MKITAEMASLVRNLLGSKEFAVFETIWNSYRQDNLNKLLNLDIKDQGYESSSIYLRGLYDGMGIVDKVRMDLNNIVKRSLDESVKGE